MEPITLAAIGAGTNALGGILGNIFSQGDRQKAVELQKAALDEILNTQTPTADQLRIALEKYRNAGNVDPAMQEVISQQASAMNDIQLDPRLKAAQMNALAKLQQIGSTGLRPEDMAALDKINNDSARAERAAEESIIQNMQQRGQGGSGAEIAARLSAAQNSANRANDQGLSMAAQASQNALQAIMNSGTLGGNIGQQDFGQQSQVANANDVISRYNALNSQQVSNANVSAKNAAQAANLANQQSILNANTGVANQQNQYNAQVPMQVYNANMGKATASANARGNMANTMNNQASQTQQMYSGIGQGVGQGITGYAANQAKAAADTKAQANYDKYLDILKGKNSGSSTP